MESITWPVAIALVGCLITLLTFLKSYLAKNDKPWQADIDTDRRTTDSSRQQLEQRIIITESSLDDFRRRLEELKADMKSDKINNSHNIDKLEERLEKLTQLVIDILGKL